MKHRYKLLELALAFAVTLGAMHYFLTPQEFAEVFDGVITVAAVCLVLVFLGEPA